jgi:hypothetical protein
MKLSDLKKTLPSLSAISFRLPDGSSIPAHFHVTEIGQLTKRFIDCGGTVRDEKLVSFQLWEAGDFDHRIAPQKLADIIALSEKVLGIEDAEIEVEYQRETIGKYALEFNGTDFMLTTKNTACLASDSCGAPAEKTKLKLSDLSVQSASCCTPGGGCC